MPWSKTASLCQDTDGPQPTKTLQSRRIFRELNNDMLAELPSVLTTDTRLDLFIARWITTLIFNSCRPTAVLIGTSNNQVPSIKSGTWWSVNITPWHENWARLITMGVGRIFQGGASRGFSLNFFRGGPKAVKFVFIPRNWKNNLFLLIISKSRGGKPPLPPSSDAHVDNVQ